MSRSGIGMASISDKPTRIPLEDTARMLNRRGGLYLSESQLRGLAAGLFIGSIAAFAGLAWSMSVAYRRLTK